MRLYESVFIARQDVSPAHVEQLTQEFSAIIENDGGKILKTEFWGLRTLAYRIKKNRKGHYVMLNLEAEPKTLAEYERIMGLNEDVLRFLTIKIDAISDEPSVMMQYVKPDRPFREEQPIDPAFEKGGEATMRKTETDKEGTSQEKTPKKETVKKEKEAGEKAETKPAKKTKIKEGETAEPKAKEGAKKPKAKEGAKEAKAKEPKAKEAKAKEGSESKPKAKKAPSKKSPPKKAAPKKTKDSATKTPKSKEQN